MAFGNNDMNKVAEAVAKLMDQGVDIETILMSVCGLFIGTYYQTKNPNLQTQAQITQAAEKEIGYFIVNMAPVFPALGLNSGDKRIPVILSAIITSHLSQTGVGAGPNTVNPGAFNPNLDRPQQGQSLEQMMREVERKFKKDE